MKKNVIFHNPRCSKSRSTLTLLEDHGINIEIVEYLQSPPTQAELKFICKKLGMQAKELVRTKEKIFSELGLSIQDKRSNDDWIRILHKHPKLLERPIVVYKQNVAIGRPPEDVLKIIP